MDHAKHAMQCDTTPDDATKQGKVLGSDGVEIQQSCALIAMVWAGCCQWYQAIGQSLHMQGNYSCSGN